MVKCPSCGASLKVRDDTCYECGWEEGIENQKDPETFFDMGGYAQWFD